MQYPANTIPPIHISIYIVPIGPLVQHMQHMTLQTRHFSKHVTSWTKVNTRCVHVHCHTKQQFSIERIPQVYPSHTVMFAHPVTKNTIYTHTHTHPHTHIASNTITINQSINELVSLTVHHRRVSSTFYKSGQLLTSHEVTYRTIRGETTREERGERREREKWRGVERGGNKKGRGSERKWEVRENWYNHHINELTSCSVVSLVSKKVCKSLALPVYSYLSGQ